MCTCTGLQWSASCSGHFTLEKAKYSLGKRLGKHQNQSGSGDEKKILCPYRKSVPVSRPVVGHHAHCTIPVPSPSTLLLGLSRNHMLNVERTSASDCKNLFESTRRMQLSKKLPH
jgi:hypothetical protein